MASNITMITEKTFIIIMHIRCSKVLPFMLLQCRMYIFMKKYSTLSRFLKDTHFITRIFYFWKQLTWERFHFSCNIYTHITFFYLPSLIILYTPFLDKSTTVDPCLEWNVSPSIPSSNILSSLGHKFSNSWKEKCIGKFKQLAGKVNIRNYIKVCAHQII